jgi:tetratricopeptide (TPR) repeat protein
MMAHGLLARYFLSSGAPDKALENLRLVVERNPKDVGAWTLAAVIHEQRSDWPRAREAYEKALSIVPRSYQVQNNLAVILGEHFGELDRAIELAKSARELAPTDPGVADTLGWLLYQRGDYVQAARLLRESADRMSDSAEVRFHLGMAQYALGDEVGSLASLQLAISKEPKAKWAADALQRLTVLKLTPPVSPKQKSDLDAHLKASPNDTIAWTRFADFLEHQGDRDGALEAREKVVKLNPQSGRALFALSKLHRARGDRDKALAFAKDARRVAPEDTELALELGRLTLDARDYATSFPLLQDAARRSPSDASIHYDLGKAALAVGRIDDSRSAWTRALELESVSAQAPGTRETLTLLDAFTVTPVPPAAAALARRRLESDPNDLASLVIAARLSQGAGDNEAARTALEKTVATYPDYLPARRALILLLATNPTEDRRTADLAASAREQLAADREVTRALGMVAHRVGDHRRAITLLEATVRHSPDDALAWFSLGLSQQSLNQVGNARASLQKALDKGLSGDTAEKARQAFAALGK